MLLLLLYAIIIAACTAFQFDPVLVTPASRIILETTEYTIFMDRQFLNAIQTNWSSSPVPQNSLIIVKFPNDYTLTGNETCNSLQINSNTPINNCTISISISNKTITINNAIPSSIAISSVTVVLKNVVNPYPAVTTSPFICTIGVDTSLNDLFATVTLLPAPFTTCGITFANQIVNTTSNMIVNLITKNEITSNGSIRIKFSSTLRWTREATLTHLLPLSSISCSSLNSIVNTGVICQGNNSTQTITLNNLTNTTIPKNSSISISIGGLFSPPTTEPADILTVSSMFSNGSLIDNSDCSITNLKVKPLIEFNVSVTEKKTINTGVTLNLTFIAADTITNEDYLEFHFPIGTAITTSSISSRLPFRVNTPPNFYPATGILNVTQPIASTQPNNSFIIIYFSFYQTPTSVKPTEDIVLRVMKAGYSKMEGKVKFVADPNTYDFNVNLNTTATGVPVECKLNFTMLDSITSTGYIILNIPSEFTIGSLSVEVQSNSSQTSTTPTLTKLSQTSYNISSLSSSSVPPQTLTLIIRHLSTPAYAQNISNFSMSIYYSSENYLTANGNQLDKLEIPAGVITNVIGSVSPNTTYTSGEISLSFSLQNGIDVSGTIVITIPKQIQTTSPSCILSNTISNSTIPQTCLYNSITNQITITLSTQITTAQRLSLTIGSIKTPNSTYPTETFKIITYDSGLHTIDVLSDMVRLIVEPNNVVVATSRETETNSGEGWWEIKVDLIQDFESSQTNKIWLNFASEITIKSNLTATINSNPTIVTISNNTPLSLIINIPSTTNKSFILNLSTLVNPPSLEELLSPYNILVGYEVSNRSYFYSKGVGGNIKNSVASEFEGVGYVFGNTILFDMTTLGLDILLTSYHQVSSIVLKLNSALTFPSIVNCSSPTALICSANSSILTITSSQPFPQTIHIQISPISTPMSYLAIYPPSILTSYNLNGYAISNNSDIKFVSKCIENCWKCEANGFNCLECYKEEHHVNNQKYLEGKTCVETCSNGWFADGFSCLQCGGNCLECENTSTSCTVCPNSTYLYEEDCLQTCPNTTYPSPPSNQTLTCLPCPDPCHTCSLTSLSIICTSCKNPLYLHNGNCIGSCPTSITVPNLINQTCDKCYEECLTCEITINTCTSCNSSYVLINSSCLNECGDAKIIVNGSCVECLPECSKCKIDIDNCLQCRPGYFLHNNTCNISCPPHYYENTNLRVCGYCGNLPLNCTNCDLTGQKCLSCEAPYIFFNEQCILKLPDGYYNDSGEGKKCENECKTCNISSHHCLTCIDGLLLEGNDCVANCSNGSTPIGNICRTCNPPCAECSNSTSTCTACENPNYLYRPNSTCISSCPNTTYPSSTTQTCELCPSPCKTCLLNMTCTSCENDYYLNSNGECVDTCSDGWVGVNGICLECQNPCSECIFDVTNCTVCLGQFYAYEGKCIEECPLLITIPDNNNMICTHCASPCETCINLTTTCTSCITGMNLHNNQCLQTCPNTTYPEAKKCLPCQPPCLSCSSSTICISCPTPLLMYQTTCIDTCPSTHAIIRQSKCVSCSPTIINCITCTSSLECLTCENEFILFQNACYIDCPTGYVKNSEKETCITIDQNADEELNNVLTTSSIFPMPFTIIWISIFVAMIMSKLQNKNTYLIGAAYCTSGVLETGALIFLTIKFYLFSRSLSRVSATESTTEEISGVNEIPLLAIGLIIIYAINLIGLAVQTPLLYWDKQFQVWLQNHCFHKFFFAVTSILSVLISYKLKLVLFCKLFSFSCTRGQLESVQKFRVFNFLSFLGVGHEAFVIYVSVVLILRFQNQIMNHEIFLIFIDTIAVTCLGIIFSIIASKKDDEFFVEEAENGYKLNKKIIAEGDDYCKEGLDPKFLKGEENKIQQMDSFQKMFLDEHDENDEYEDEEISLSISENKSEMDKNERMKRNYDKNLAAANIEGNKSEIYNSKKLSQDREEASYPMNRDLFKEHPIQMNNTSHNILIGKESEREYKEDEAKDKSESNAESERQLNANDISKGMIQKTDRSESKGTYMDKMQVIFDGEESEESEKEQNKEKDGEIENKIAEKMKELEELKLSTYQENEQTNENTGALKQDTEHKTFEVENKNEMFFDEEDLVEHNDDEFIKENSTLIQLERQERLERRLFEEQEQEKIDDEFEFMGDMAESKMKMENNFIEAEPKIIEECEHLEEVHDEDNKNKSKILDSSNNQLHNELHDEQNNLENQNEEMVSSQNINLDDQSDHKEYNDNYFDGFLEEKQEEQQSNTIPRQFSLKEGEKENIEQLEPISSTDQIEADLVNHVKEQPNTEENANQQNGNTQEPIQEQVNQANTNKKKKKYKGILDFEDQGKAEGSGLDDSSPEFDEEINNNPLRSSFASENRSIELPRREQQNEHPLVNLLQVSSSKNQTESETRRDDNARTTLTQYFGHSETKTTRPSNLKPPLQRPSSQEKGRLYAAGVRQMEANKRNSREKSRKKSEESEEPQPMISFDHKKKNKSLYSVPMNKMSRKDSREVSDLTDEFIHPSSSEDIHMSNLNYSSTMNIETNNEPDKPKLIGLTSRPNYKGVSTSQERNRNKKEDNPSSGGSEMFRKKSFANSQQEDDEDELDEFYGRKLSKSRSKEKSMSRESLERMKQLEKVYLQRLDGGKKH